MDEDNKNQSKNELSEEDDAMSKLSNYIKNNKELVYSFATQNTPMNKDGRAIITKDDEWRNEPEWDKIFKETAGK